MSTQSAIIDVIKGKGSAPVTAIASITGLSVSYIRTQLAALEAAAIIERVDERVPIYYRVNPNSPAIQLEQMVAAMKKNLMAPSDKEDNFISKHMKTVAKSHWPKAIDLLAAASQAVKELHEEGKLVDTL